jgi:predicted transcriptional regulator
MIEFQALLKLPAFLYERLEALAQERQTSLEQTVQEALAQYLMPDTEAEATPESLRQGFKQGWREIQAGQTRPVADILRDLREGK